MTRKSEIMWTRTASKAARVHAQWLVLASLGFFALLLLLFVHAPSVWAAPIHPPVPALDLNGFNHACGVATDSEGDVYVSSAGESKVRIFDSGHNELKAIPNSNEPCGLAVDSNGNLYVSESKTGNVVKYVPNAFPFSGTPTYGAPIAIDSSGKAKGIAVDPFDDRLYVAEGSRISIYDSTGTSAIDERQQVRVFEATGGTFKLIFQSNETKAIKWDASHKEVEDALAEKLGVGNVSVDAGSGGALDHIVTFEGTLGGSDVELLKADTSGLTGGGSNKLIISEQIRGFSGHIGEGVLTEATGAAAHTFASGDRYLFIADPAGPAADKVYVFGGNDFRALKPRRTIDGSQTPDGGFGFGPASAYLAADPGACPPTSQACTAGHFFVYDDAHKAVDEFEASGQYLTQIKLTDADPGFADAQPTSVAIDRSDGPGEGTLYVSSGASTGARILAFGPLALPSRSERPDLSLKLENACGVAVDSSGNRYVAADAFIYVYGPTGALLATIEDAGRPCDLAVDSAGNVYALDRNKTIAGDEKAVYFTPDSFPPTAGAKYSGPTTIATASDFSSSQALVSIGINPANGHVFVSQAGQTIEFKSAANGSGILNSAFASGLGLTQRADVAVEGSSGNVYMADGNTVFILNSSGTEVLARINGSGSPKGPFGLLNGGSTAVDQANGHLLLFRRAVAEEYEPSGAFVAEFGPFQEVVRIPGIAVDNSGGSNDGDVFIAFDDPGSETYDLTAFGPLTYGEPPVAVTGTASKVGGGKATLNGTVDPRGSALEECDFQYTTDADFKANGFTGAAAAPCVPGIGEIGSGTEPVAVHTDLSGLEADQRYRFRLVAQNKYGTSSGSVGLFGPPLITTQPAQPISYAEATLRASIDPSGLATKYHFEYGIDEGYGQITATGELPPGDGVVAVQVSLTGLADGSTYHFRIVAENEASIVSGPDQTFTTLIRPPALSCPNAEFRTRRSANLPDCRAYELVTPADTRGGTPYAAGSPFAPGQFNNWLVTPRGVEAGNNLAFFLDGTLPGFNGNGRLDGYRAERIEGDVPHPAKGWGSQLFAPSFVEAGGSQPAQQGVAADQHYSFWHILPLEVFEETLAEGSYLRTPAGFEPLGQGGSGSDLNAEGRFLSSAGAHVIFDSEAHLEQQAPPTGTEGIYDRAVGGSTHVISLNPDGSSLPAGEDASYLGATEDGSAVAFEVGGALYLRRNNAETVRVADAPNTFAGISEDGKLVFYTSSTEGDTPGDLFVFDLDTNSATQIAEEAVFVNVSADGSHVYLTSEETLDEAEEGTPGAENLYVWESTGNPRFIAVLDSQDLVSFDGTPFVNLLRWTDAVGPEAGGFSGRAQSPTRSTPDGEVFVFQSHADLTLYESEGHTQIYRYDATAQSLLCISCDPSGASPDADASLQSPSGEGSTVAASTLIPNLTDDGRAVFFQSEDPLLPEDANGVRDVYEWKAGGEAGGCKGEGACLALISSGQGDTPNYLYSMTPDGHDVFFTTLEALVGADVTGSPSIYDARVAGGIPDPATPHICEGDACKDQSSPVPSLPVPGGDTRGAGNPRPPGKPPCHKGRRRVVRHGKARCVKKHHKGRHHKGKGRR